MTFRTTIIFGLIFHAILFVLLALAFVKGNFILNQIYFGLGWLVGHVYMAVN